MRNANSMRAPLSARRATLALVGALLLLAGCGGIAVQNPAPLSTVAAPPASDQYTIGPGDELDVRFFYNPDLNQQLVVRPDGRVSMPLIGELMAAGRSPAELEQMLRQGYAKELRQPDVSVMLRGFAGQRVYVDGQVGQPTMIEMPGRLTALQSIASAQGFLPSARANEVILIRRGADQRPVVTTLNLEAALSGTDLSQDVLLRPHDILFVPRSPIANVNLWVDQYIRQNIPVPFTFGYNLGD